MQASCHYGITWSRHGAPQDRLRLLEVKKGFSGGSEDDHVTPASWRHVRLEAREVECRKKQEKVLGTCTRGQGVGHRNLWWLLETHLRAQAFLNAEQIEISTSTAHFEGPAKTSDDPRDPETELK